MEFLFGELESSLVLCFFLDKRHTKKKKKTKTKKISQRDKYGNLHKWLQFNILFAFKQIILSLQNLFIEVWIDSRCLKEHTREN